MRPILLALLVQVLCLAQGPLRPEVVAPNPHHDFGRIPPSVTVTHRFQVLNQGDGPLTIAKVTAACGCTSTVLGRAVLAPGEGTEVEVTFNPSGHLGPNHKSVDLLSDDPVHPALTLTFDAEVLPEVHSSMDEVPFEDLVRTERRKASVKIGSNTGQPLRVSKVDLTDAPWLGVATRQEGKDLFVDLELVARLLPANRLTGTDGITLHVQNPNASTINLFVRWELRSPVVATPPRVIWVGAAEREQRTKVVLKHRRKQRFRILSARTSDPLFQVTGLAAKAAAVQEVQFVLSAQAKPGDHEGKAYLTLDTPGHPEVELRMAASLK